MPVFTVHGAQTQLSKLLAQVQDGEEVVIARGKEPVARLVPFQSAKPRRPGALNGRIALTPAFFEPLSADEIAARGEDPPRHSSPDLVAG
ncbi:MAG: type II toxin-antitoxin system Phd/YefM family antitoxin [Janthinobacterium lividum]